MASPTYRFGDYRLDPAGRELWRRDEEVVLRRKVFDVVAYLVEHHDRAVEHKELFTAVWGEIGLSERTLPQAVLEARRALEDSADNPRYIKTVPGYGYHWIAPVEVELPPTEPATLEPQATPAAPHPPSRPRRPLWPWLTAALLAAAALAGAAIYHLRSSPEPLHDPATPMAEGEIALLLPVTVEPHGRPAWIRLGAMEHIAERLRAAGQPMVPSDNVIALARNLSPEPTPEELDTLVATTGARLVLAARAEAEDQRWRVSLRSLAGSQPPLTARGEAEDVLEALRAAADHLALSLGRTPAPDPDAEPGLALLVQQITAAMLAEQRDVARELIAAADPELRTHPEIRFQQARLDYYGHDLEAAEAGFETLLAEVSVDHDPVLRAKIVNGLGVVHYLRGDQEGAERLLEEAADHFAQGNRLDMLGLARSNLGLMVLRRGDLETAREHLARARRPLMSTGDVVGLAALSINLGVLAGLRERWPEALGYAESAADGHAALHSIGGELRARANAVQDHLQLLDPQAALAVEPRLRELLPQTENPDITAYANVTRARLLFAVGQTRAAESLLAEVLRATDGRAGLEERRQNALVLHAEQAALRKDGATEAAHTAAEAVDQIPKNDILMAAELGRAWLTLVRSDLAVGRFIAAREATTAMTEWADGGSPPAPRIYAALAQAELAAAEGRPEAAHAAFERALSLADAGHAPLRLLEVARAYVPWLLTGRPGNQQDPERATLVADRIARYAERDYGAALLQLRLYHGTGPPAAWRAALRRARSLAGERQIPPELSIVPEVPPDPVEG